jgi:hypothetical protein
MPITRRLHPDLALGLLVSMAHLATGWHLVLAGPPDILH